MGLFVAKRAETHPPFRERLPEPGQFPYYGFPRPIRKALRAFNAAETFRACLERKLRPRPGMHSIRNGYCLISVEAERHDRSRHCKAIAGFDELSTQSRSRLACRGGKELNDAARRGELVLWQVLEFFFVIDVVASLVLFARFEKKEQLQ